MLATEPSLSAYDSILKSTTNSVRNDISEMQSSGRHYVTPDVNKNLNRICRGVDYMHLDTNLLTSSPAWAKKFDENRLLSEKSAASRSMDKVSAVLGNVKKNMTLNNVNDMQDNQVREIHHWATTNLNNVQQDLGPYKEASVSRLTQFCDHVGVTDRYTGYRNNLNRGNKDPTRRDFKWLDKKPNEYNNTLNVEWTPRRSAPAKGRQVTWSDMQDREATTGITRPQTAPISRFIPARPNTEKGLAYSGKSIQERCGINTVFPGRTEYMIRYQEPVKDPTVGFTVNPKPNFLMHGRPLSETQFYTNNSEYQFRYEWPDSEKITKLPWLRK